MYNIVKLLTSPQKQDDLGKSALHIVTRIGDFHLVEKLLTSGANPNVKDCFENTPLSISCIEMPNRAIVKLLLIYGADYNFGRLTQIDLFLECVLNCHTQEQLNIIKLFIEKGININMTDTVSNRNCMHFVALNGNIELAKLLLKNGAILNIRDNFNCTPLQIASKHRNYEIFIHFKTFLDRN